MTWVWWVKRVGKWILYCWNMWSETDLDDHFVPEHLMNHMNSRQKNVENGDYPQHGHVSHDSLVDHALPHHNHLLRHDMLTDAMLGHVPADSRDRDQVKIWKIKWGVYSLYLGRQPAQLLTAAWVGLSALVTMRSLRSLSCYLANTWPLDTFTSIVSSFFLSYDTVLNIVMTGVPHFISLP